MVFALIAFAACTTGGLESTGGGGGGSGSGVGSGSGGGEERTVDIEGPEVLPHVQRYANRVCTALGSCTISTYEGHHPTASRALDTLVSDQYGSVPSDDNALGDAVAQYALDHMAENGIWYVIWRQRYNDGSGWEPMEDRGSITQNHYDHVHVSFNETAP
ncbi:MAG TPA: hypothetical protein VFQ53_28375 [Kofleriaceae bacterium]|nr:hypothetical protein [Kofleriaceae bacterium]